MKEMERQQELHPDLGQSALNKGVEDGIIKGGIELEEPIHDEADEIGKGTKGAMFHALHVADFKFSFVCWS